MSYPPGPVITTLTAAIATTARYLLQSYNISGAKPMKWAKGRKCDFISKGCESVLTDSDGSPGSSRPFCNWQDYVVTREKKYRCDSEYTQVVACDWRRYSKQAPKEIPLLFENATAKIALEDHTGIGLAGSEPVFYYCPVWKGIYDYKEKLLKTCANHLFQPDLESNFALEVYSTSSICVEQEKVETLQCDSSTIKKKTQGVFLGAGCYEYKCEYGHLHLRAYAPEYLRNKVSYVGQFKVCWAEGSRVMFSRMFGSEDKDDLQHDHRVTLICPSCKAICENNPRYENFTCSPDISNVNSRDYIGWFCGRGSHATWNTALCLFLLFINVLNSLMR
ncbi:hypothetical protein D918_02511 [Trichuris suis]|nr:hypothetical protein D918_02511 [Trichuris suis]